MTTDSPARVPLDESVRAWVAGRRHFLIGEDLVDTDETLDVEDPGTGRKITEVAEAAEAHVDRAVDDARAAFDDGRWRWMAASARSRLILRFAELVEQNAEQLAQLDAIDGGVPIGYARASIADTVETIEYAAGIPARISGHTVAPANQPGDRFQAQIIREPLGVVGQIVPWNLPFSMAGEKVALGLATANTVVLKPAEQTPLSALRLAELVLEAGIPPGVVNVVPGRGATAGAALVRNPRVSKISFTGSTVTGKAIAAKAAENLTPVSLELGGKSPFIVFADADLSIAAEAAVANGFAVSGQACTAPSRMFVQRDVIDEFLAAVAEHTARLVVGDAMDENTVMGPLVSAQQHDRVRGYVDGALRDGAVATCGGRPVDGPGYFFEPTVLTATTPAMTINREEIFGPVLSVSPFDTVDEVITLANDTTYGLAAGVWTDNLTAAQRLTRDLQAGSVWINCYNMFDPALPFGGYKHSGWGRETGTAAVELYTQTKTVAAAIGGLPGT